MHPMLSKKLLAHSHHPRLRLGNKRDYTSMNRAGLAAEAHFAHRRAKKAREVEATGTHGQPPPRPR
jgi:hypothetical protein